MLGSGIELAVIWPKEIVFLKHSIWKHKIKTQYYVSKNNVHTYKLNWDKLKGDKYHIILVSRVNKIIVWTQTHGCPFPLPSLGSMTISLPSCDMPTERVSFLTRPMLLKGSLSVCCWVGIVSLSQLSYQVAALKGHRIKATSLQKITKTHIYRILKTQHTCLYVHAHTQTNTHTRHTFIPALCQFLWQDLFTPEKVELSPGKAGVETSRLVQHTRHPQFY